MQCVTKNNTVPASNRLAATARARSARQIKFPAHRRAAYLPRYLGVYDLLPWGRKDRELVREDL